VSEILKPRYGSWMATGTMIRMIDAQNSGLWRPEGSKPMGANVPQPPLKISVNQLPLELGRDLRRKWNVAAR
jgi:hypothetical protein